jgi:hypothetical protein
VFQDGSEAPPTYSRRLVRGRESGLTRCTSQDWITPPSLEPGAGGSGHKCPKLIPRPRSRTQRRVASKSPRNAAFFHLSKGDGPLAGEPPPCKGERKPEPRAPTSRAPPFTAARFHVLLNSLFKVLFNFPSRYLFAIGLGVIFSLARSLPRALSCTPKQLDSGEEAGATLRTAARAYHPPWAVAPVKVDLGRSESGEMALPNATFRATGEGRRFGAGLRPFHSPLLGASLLFSFPPLINMLKFGGYSCLLSGRK